MVFAYEIKIPKSRIAVLIGKAGSTKKELEEMCEVKMNIDSKEGDVTIEGEDALKLYSCKEIVTAIARGFNPEFAKLLFKQDYSLELINIGDYATTKNSMLRLKGRVIGKDGRSRNYIENLTGTYVVIEGKTIGIIGEISRVLYSRRAVEQLLKGSPHKNVYRWLEAKMKDLRGREMLERNPMLSRIAREKVNDDAENETDNSTDVSDKNNADESVDADNVSKNNENSDDDSEDDTNEKSDDEDIEKEDQ